MNNNEDSVSRQQLDEIIKEKKIQYKRLYAKYYRARKEYDKAFLRQEDLNPLKKEIKELRKRRKSLD